MADKQHEKPGSAVERREEGRRAAAWDPFRELADFGDWGSWLERGFPFRDLGLRGRRFGDAVRAIAPAIDVTESEDAYTVTAELPGVKREDVQVELHEGVLTIRGEKRTEREGKDERTRWTERSFGSFCRAFTLPRDASHDRIQASFQDGVLTVRVAKSEASKPRSIQIEG